MTTIGFLGSGNIGSTVARLAVDAGHRVVMSNSRGPETLADLVAELGDAATAATAEDAARAGDIVVVTVPLKATPDLPAAELAGKTVIDTNNYYPERDGRIAGLDEHTTTTSRLVQEHLADARVVKGFNNIFFRHLAVLGRPAGSAERSTLPIWGDDASAVEDAVRLLDALGYDALVAGDLDESWRAENGQPVYVHPYSADEEMTPQRAGTEAIREALAAATRDGTPPAE